jgi:hypothetical protein
MRSRAGKIVRFLATVVVISLLGLLFMVTRPLIPEDARTLFLPAVVLLTAMIFMPVKMTSGWRLTATAFVFLLLFAATRLQPGYALRNALYVIAIGWGVSQILLVVATERIRAGTAGAWTRVLHTDGYFGVLRAMDRGDFGPHVARMFATLRAAGLILIGTLLLIRAGSLDQPEENIVFAVRPWERSIDSQHTVIVTLTTTDNNTVGYLRTALELHARFRAAGAAVMCYPHSGSLDAVGKRLKDSLDAQGAITYVQRDPSWSMFREHWGRAYTSFRVTDLTWRYAKPVVHPGLVAVARFKGVPIALPEELRHPPSISNWEGLPQKLRDPRLTIGEIVVPISDDGTSAVLNPWTESGLKGRWDYFLFPAGVMRSHWDSSITYLDYSSGKQLTSLPDSVWNILKGRMVFLNWDNQGEEYPRADATFPAVIAERVMNGLIVTRTGAWAVGLSVLILVIGILLSWGKRIWIPAAFFIACTAGVLVLDGWLFREYMLVAGLIYPAFTAAVAAVVLPLVMMAKR